MAHAVAEAATGLLGLSSGGENGAMGAVVPVETGGVLGEPFVAVQGDEAVILLRVKHDAAGNAGAEGAADGGGDQEVLGGGHGGEGLVGGGGEGGGDVDAREAREDVGVGGGDVRGAETGREGADEVEIVGCERAGHADDEGVVDGGGLGDGLAQGGEVDGAAGELFVGRVQRGGRGVGETQNQGLERRRGETGQDTKGRWEI